MVAEGGIFEDELGPNIKPRDPPKPPKLPREPKPVKAETPLSAARKRSQHSLAKSGEARNLAIKAQSLDFWRVNTVLLDSG